MNEFTATAKTPESVRAVEQFADSLKKQMLVGLDRGYVVTFSNGWELGPMSGDPPDKLITASNFQARISLPEFPCSAPKSA